MERLYGLLSTQEGQVKFWEAQLKDIQDVRNEMRASFGTVNLSDSARTQIHAAMHGLLEARYTVTNRVRQERSSLQYLEEQLVLGEKFLKVDIPAARSAGAPVPAFPYLRPPPIVNDLERPLAGPGRFASPASVQAATNASYAARYVPPPQPDASDSEQSQDEDDNIEDGDDSNEDDEDEHMKHGVGYRSEDDTEEDDEDNASEHSSAFSDDGNHNSDPDDDDDKDPPQAIQSGQDFSTNEHENDVNMEDTSLEDTEHNSTNTNEQAMMSSGDNDTQELQDDTVIKQEPGDTNEAKEPPQTPVKTFPISALKDHPAIAALPIDQETGDRSPSIIGLVKAHTDMFHQEAYERLGFVYDPAAPVKAKKVMKKRVTFQLPDDTSEDVNKVTETPTPGSRAERRSRRILQPVNYTEPNPDAMDVDNSEKAKTTDVKPKKQLLITLKTGPVEIHRTGRVRRTRVVPPLPEGADDVIKAMVDEKARDLRESIQNGTFAVTTYSSEYVNNHIKCLQNGHKVAEEVRKWFETASVEQLSTPVSDATSQMMQESVNGEFGDFSETQGNVQFDHQGVLPVVHNPSHAVGDEQLQQAHYHAVTTGWDQTGYLAGNPQVQQSGYFNGTGDFYQSGFPIQQSLLQAGDYHTQQTSFPAPVQSFQQAADSRPGQFVMPPLLTPSGTYNWDTSYSHGDLGVFQQLSGASTQYVQQPNASVGAIQQVFQPEYSASGISAFQSPVQLSQFPPQTSSIVGTPSSIVGCGGPVQPQRFDVTSQYHQFIDFDQQPKSFDHGFVTDADHDTGHDNIDNAVQHQDYDASIQGHQHDKFDPDNRDLDLPVDFNSHFTDVVNAAVAAASQSTAYSELYSERSFPHTAASSFQSGSSRTDHSSTNMMMAHPTPEAMTFSPAANLGQLEQSGSARKRSAPLDASSATGNRPHPHLHASTPSLYQQTGEFDGFLDSTPLFHQPDYLPNGTFDNHLL